MSTWPPFSHQDVQDEVQAHRAALAAGFAAGELAYGETNVAQTITSTTPVVVTNCDVTVPATTRTVKLTGIIPWIVADGVTTIVVALQDVTNNVELQRAVHDFPGAGTNAFRPIVRRIPASASARRIQMQASLYSGTVAVHLYNNFDMAFLLAEGL